MNEMDNNILTKLEEMKDKIEFIEKDILSYVSWIKENINFILNNLEENHHVQ